MTRAHFPSFSPVRCISIVAVLVLLAFALPSAQATEVNIGLNASQYVVLYEGIGGHNLQITNVTKDGNIGVGGTGKVQDSGPSTIAGRLDFSAANTGQFSNNNGSNVGPTSVNYSVAAVTSALNDVAELNSDLAGLGNTLALNGTQTVNESAGKLETIAGATYRVFNVSSYSSGDGKTLTINGDGSGNPVVFNFGFGSNVNLGGDVTLNGLNADQGIILAPNDVLSVTNSNLDGRVFGGDSNDMQIVSGDTIKAPAATPEPAT